MNLLHNSKIYKNNLHMYIQRTFAWTHNMGIVSLPTLKMSTLNGHESDHYLISSNIFFSDVHAHIHIYTAKWVQCGHLTISIMIIKPSTCYCHSLRCGHS